MKKALSLLLALSMVLSLFTVSAFADDEPTDTPDGSAGKPYSLTVTGSATIVVGGKTMLTATPPATTEGQTVTYTWSSDSNAVTVSGSGTTCTVTGVAATESAVTVTCTAAVTTTTPAEGDTPASTTTEYYRGTSDITVEADTYKLAFVEGKSAQRLSLVKDSTGTLTTTGSDVQLVKVENLVETAVESQPAITVKSDKTSVATISGTVITAKGAGTANIIAEASYMGKTYTITLCTVTVGELAVSATITNGGYKIISFANLASDIAAKLKTLTNAAEAPAVSSITISAPGSTSIFSLYDGGATAATSPVTLSSSGSVTVTAKAGSIGSQTLSLTAVAGGVTYTGTLTLKSDYKGTIVTASQNALFAKEEFYLDSISGIAKVQKYSSSTASTSYADTAVVDVTSYLVTPKTTDWTEELIGYDADQVAYRVNVSFTAAYDMGAVAVDGDAPFSADAFQAFVKAVNDEQSDDYSYALDTVKFTTVSGTGWTLYKGGSKLTATALSVSDLKNVTIRVTKAGTYDIPFTVSYKYYAASTSTEATGYYYGIFRVIAVADGDIKYDVSYGQSVTFRTMDFQSFYRTATGSSTATLSYVTFDELPAVGRLYTAPGQVTGGYWATIANAFYANPAAAQLALSGVTYTAAYSPKTQYSVYIPFTAYGSGAAKSGVVEIVVNGALPFTDIDIDHTFYEYIKYVYNNNIMNGKTDTYFNATASLTRVQLVVTLYRMSGSPSTYNYQTLPFSDTKGLSTEFANAVKWAVANKIVEGYNDNTFQPNAAVSRQAMVTVLYRYAKDQGFKVGVISNTNLAGFKDSAKVSNKMADAMNWAVENGFMSGNAGYLNPTGSTTRGAAAKILAVFHDTYIA